MPLPESDAMPKPKPKPTPRMGRPPIPGPERTRRVFKITDQDFDFLFNYGNDNATEGLRRLIAAARKEKK